MRDTSDNSDTEEEQMEIEQEEEVEPEICAQCANLLKRKSRGGRPNDLLSVSGAWRLCLVGAGHVGKRNSVETV